MQYLVFDPRFGAAGDMILSSLLALGADREAVSRAVSAVSALTTEETNRCGIPALSLKTNTGKTHRTLADIITIIDAADASDDAKALAKRVFDRIEKAEEIVHQSHHVHFHEVGADDAIADVLGSCTALLSLNPAGVRILPLSVGFGTLTCSHGVMPVPAPATAEILKESGIEVLIGGFEGELCTPTGAALLSEFAASFPAPAESGKLLALGRGAGSRDPADHPNIFTAYLMEAGDDEHTIDVLETNVDDVSGEILAETLSRLMEAGARDASITPLIMKKGRAGHLIRIVCMPKDSLRLAKLLARETGSLGVRCIPMTKRFVAERRSESVTAVINGRVYTASVKQAELDGEVYSRKAEFDDCKRIADAEGVSVRDVKRIFEEEAWNCR
ncbi:MAG: nickel pincer cofactor biosynthesis protein LarC [Methanocorpusculum sp.]|nr:nickel pincer cofactor biosynthesis protein LarC [Methanocorpusculum sp.]